MNEPPRVQSGIPAVDQYLDGGYQSVVGMSSRFAAADHVRPDAHAVGARRRRAGGRDRHFRGPLLHCAWRTRWQTGEKALGIDLFDWPNPQVIDRFEANCAKHGVTAERRITWRADSRTMKPEDLLAKLGGRACVCFMLTASTPAMR